jgi:OOP family OmpA-OmpF porin
MRADKKALIAAVFGAVGLAAPATGMAQQPPERGGYVGVSIAHTDFQKTCQDLVVSCDSSDFGGKAFAGYRINRNWAVEGGYAKFGTAKGRGVIGGQAANFDRDVLAWDLTLVGSIPFSQGMSVFGKLGINRSETQFQGALNGSRFDTHDKKLASTYGAGFQVEVGSHFAMRVEWQRYNNTGGPSLTPFLGTHSEDDVNFVGAGIIYKF